MVSFSYENVEGIDKLPEEIRDKVQKKKNADKEALKTDGYRLNDKLETIRRLFEGYSYPSHLPFQILSFLGMKGSGPIVGSEEFKEMAMISAVELLSKTMADAQLLKNINLVLINVLGTKIGESELYRNIFLDQTGKRMLSSDEMKKTLDIMKEMAITKKEYLLALEKRIEKEEKERGFTWSTLEAKAFLKAEKNKLGLTTEIDFVEYLKVADRYLAQEDMHKAVSIYRLLKQAGHPLEEKKDQVVKEYCKNDEYGNLQGAKRVAKRVGLIPYNGIWDRLIG